MALLLTKRLDLYIHAGREVQLHQSVNRLLRGLEDIEQTFVRTQLKLLTRFLIYVRRAENRIAVLERRQRNRARDRRAGTLGRIDNIARRLVQDPVIVGL